MGHETTEQNLALYLRLPTKITDPQQVQELHPDIKTVVLPRQSARWCKIKFEDIETCISVRNKLRTHRINGKRLYVNFLRKGRNRKVKTEEVDLAED